MRSFLLLTLIALLLTGTAQARPLPERGNGYSLRFFGNGYGDIDRVKIKLDDPARPIDVGRDFTIEWWMKATTQNNPTDTCTTGPDNWIYGNIIIDRDVYGAGDYGDFGVSLGGGRLMFGYSRGNNGAGICGDTVVTDGEWHHIAVTRHATGTFRLWVDGKLDAEGVGAEEDISYRNDRTTLYINDPYLVIGAEKHDAGTEYPSYRGLIDEMRISNVVRYEAQFPRPTQPFPADGATVGLYHLDEGSGIEVGDSSGAVGGPSRGEIRYGGNPAGPLWSTDTPFSSTGATPTPTFQTNPTPSRTATRTYTATATIASGPSSTATPTPTPPEVPSPTATPTRTRTATAISGTPTATAIFSELLYLPLVRRR